jgi:hypothetical protein
MLKEAYMSQLGYDVSEKDCVIVCREKGNDELAPSKKLFWSFYNRKKELEVKLGEGSPEAHNQAFTDSRYPERFRQQILNDPEAMEKLKAITERSKTEDVYLVCYEGWSKACHRRILLRICREQFYAGIEVQGVEL